MDKQTLTSPFFLYGLFDPRDGELRYVGKSSTGMRRVRRHTCPAIIAKDRSHRANWLRSLVSEGLLPEVQILEELPNDSALNELEKQAIAHYRAMGFDLVNTTDGGDGASGYRFDPAVVEARAAKLRGRLVRPETSARISAALRSLDGQIKLRSRPHRVPSRKAFVDTTTGVHYGHLLEASQALNIPVSLISKVLNGKRPHSHGHVFRYEAA